MKTADDRPLCPELKDRLRREFDRLQLVVEHIRELERIQGDRLKQASKRKESGENLSAKENRDQIAFRLCHLLGIEQLRPGLYHWKYSVGATLRIVGN